MKVRIRDLTEFARLATELGDKYECYLSGD